MILNLADWSRKAAISYSGSSTKKSITANGKQYMLYSFTGSGTLTVSGGKLKNADIWACGGGGTPMHSRGGGGGYTAQINGQTLADGQYVITIGAAQSATSISHNGTALLTANGAHAASNASDSQRGYGGSGGGEGAGGSYGGTGQGTTTRPFNDSENFTNLPCAGGGGSGNIHGDYPQYTGRGGKGGSNGSNGFAGTSSWDSTTIPTWGGDGGETGGGKGQSMGYNGATAASGTSATYYGSGGGGGYNSGRRGNGYQGWMLLRVPINSVIV